MDSTEDGSALNVETGKRKEIKLSPVHKQTYLKKYLPLVLLELEFGTVTADEIKSRLDISRTTALHVLQMMHELGMVHIERYEETKRVFALGEGIDAVYIKKHEPRPPKVIVTIKSVAKRDWIVEAFFGKENK